MLAPQYFIGLMSGTSLDGVDGVLTHLDPQGRVRIEAHARMAFEAGFKTELLALNHTGLDELHRSALAGNQIARCYADVVLALLQQSGLKQQQITAIGAHGQTVRHRPLEFDGDPTHAQAAVGYTLQLNNPALLAELTGIDVVADFRSRDLAAGGQGAPLVPSFHHSLFARENGCVAVLNIGGIANISVLRPEDNVTGWDCGPGNMLMDFWCDKHTGQPFDFNGSWAATGHVDSALLSDLLADPYLQRLPPKSSGRDLFNPAWLAQFLQAHQGITAVDVQATLTDYTAVVCANDIHRHAQDAASLIVCGGGALNKQLMARLTLHLPQVQVLTSDAFGLPALQVEAAAFAWLAYKTSRREPASLPSVTGARGARILGAIYPH
jgi:anhydro-N-acetylmuramic acid kinase